MVTPIFSFINKRIALQLLFWFLIIEFLIVNILGYMSYYQAKVILESEISDKLNSLADRQILEINNYLKQEDTDLNILTQTGDVIRAVKTLNESYEKNKDNEIHLELVSRFNKQLARYERSFDFHNLCILNPEGNVTFTSSSYFKLGQNIYENNNKELKKLAERVKYLLQSEFSDFTTIPTSDSFVFFGAAPIMEESGNFLGTLLVEISNKTIEKSINNYAGLGKAGETMLFFKRDNHVYFASNSRFQKTNKQNYILYNPNNMPLAFYNALSGQKGQIIANDYKGTPSIIKYAYVLTLGAGMTVSIPIEEAFAPIASLQRILIIIVVITFFIVVVVSIEVARIFTKPIRKLSYIARDVANGKLDVQVKVKNVNEIGQLATNFNLMIASLKRNKQELEDYSHSLESKVTERTNSLEIALSELQHQKEELLASEEELKQNAEELSVINDALAQKEKRFRKIIEDNVIGICILNSGFIVFSNQAFAHNLEYDLQEVFGKGIDEMITPIFKETFYRFLENFENNENNEKAANRIEVKFYTKKRKTIWADLSFVKVHFEGMEAILVNLIDITQSKTAELKIKESERKFKSIFENIQEGFFQIDLQGKIIMANAQAAHLLGYENVQELIGKIMQEDIYFDPEEREKMHKIMLEQGGKVDNYEVFFEKKDKTMLVVEFDKHFIYDENNNIEYVEGLFRDITNRKMNEIALIETNEKLSASEEELRQNAEELASVNENLNTIVTELKETNIQLEISRKMVEKQKANIERDNKILVQLAQNQSIQSGAWLDALQIITRIAAKRLSVERVSVWSIQETPILHIQCICFYDAETKEYSFDEVNFFERDFPMYFESILRGDTIEAVDAYKHPATQEFAVKYLPDNKIKSMLDVPFFGRNGVAGVLCIEAKYQQRDWEAEDITFVKSITDLITIAYKSYQRKQAEDQLAEQNHIIQKKNEDIIDSINYASRIQNAILPSPTFIEDLLEEYFVLFKPRDIVSGDFYWFGKVENKIIITAVDCTGHGVPGAFMSMIGTQLLNEIVSRRRITKSYLILTELHKNIRKSLKQTDKASNRDGMDMSLCVYDPKENTLEFSGAKNPIVYIQDREIFYIKGDKTAIGGEQKEEERLFTSHTIEIIKPTSVYLFTDGFQDQFGGKQVRKFMITNLRQLLLEHSEEHMIIQRETLNNTIELWMQEGNQKQIDDILIIGFKLEPTNRSK